MKQRILALFLAIAILLPLSGVAHEGAHLVIKDFPNVIRPGKMEVFRFEAAHEGMGTMTLMDHGGVAIYVIQQNFPVSQGENAILWNGFGANMQALAPGQYTLLLESAEDRLTQALTIGLPGPQITQLVLNDAQVTPGEDWQVNVTVNMPGTLAVVFHNADQIHEIFNHQVQEGMTVVSWDGYLGSQPPPVGSHTLSVVFVDETGFAANQQHITLEVLEVVEAITDEGTAVEEVVPVELEEGGIATEAPVIIEKVNQSSIREGYHYAVPTKEEVPESDIGKDFWRLPMGDYNEEAIWRIMMQPITVLWGKQQREVYRVRKTPDSSTKRENIVGEVHYESQGVHVIEQRDDGWSLVEVYNSSYGPDNRTRRGYGDTDDLIRGYIETKELKVVQPRDDYGIMIDKLKQRMYIFKEGKIFTELLISTGNPTKQQPWNETPSGEFLMVSRTGDFNAGNLVCRMSMRINGGALIHEVPYILNESTGYWDYSSQEAQLGKKASHGCVRVQRLNNDDGINMSWLWNNIKRDTKVLVWDDDNRYYEYPDNALALYFNPNGGKFYHLDQNCRSIKDRYLPLEGVLTYAELDNEAHSKLTPCAHCNPPLRASQIDEINKKNGFLGD